MHVTSVDERDNNWEDWGPRFRVYLHGSSATSTVGWTDTYDVTDANVLQVIDWAQQQAGDELTYAVALVYEDVENERMNPGCARGLVWLLGMDGNIDVEDDPDLHAVAQRMLARRHEPVAVPAADSTPDDVPQPYATGFRSGNRGTHID